MNKHVTQHEGDFYVINVFAQKLQVKGFWDGFYTQTG